MIARSLPKKSKKSKAVRTWEIRAIVCNSCSRATFKIKGYALMGPDGKSIQKFLRLVCKNCGLDGVVEYLGVENIPDDLPKLRDSQA